MILIVTSEFDVHADAVVSAFARMGFKDYLRVDLEQAVNNFEVELTLGPEVSQWRIASPRNGFSVTDETLTAVWWRRALTQLDCGYLRVPSEETLDQAETYWALRWLIESLSPRLFPLGHPVVMRAAENKIKQLMFARQIGFRIPETVWSNNKPFLMAHAKSHQRIAVKPLCAQLVKNSGEDYTSGTPLRCNAWASNDYISVINGAPTAAIYAQRCIEKTADIRITVLPHSVIACEIDSSSLPDGVIDWRQTTLEHRHQIVQLPDTFIDKLRQFLRAMDLKAGYFDFGRSTDGEMIFFECNPNAQWLWIEEMTSYPIADSIAALLTDAQLCRPDVTKTP